jgi:hypothetical protein
MNPFEHYHGRYKQLRGNYPAVLNKTEIAKSLESESECARLNNLFMAGLGMGTLFLRMGAVVQICEKIQKINLKDELTQEDIAYKKSILDNIADQLPTDGNWQNLYILSAETNSRWYKTADNKEIKGLIDKFVTLRNDIVHEKIVMTAAHAEKLEEGVKYLDAMTQMYALFEDATIQDDGSGLVYRHQGGDPIWLHPMVKKNQQGIPEAIGVLPYIFQGIYREGAKFIGTVYGDETHPANDPELDELFGRFRAEIAAFGGGKMFVHSARQNTYMDCFVGREKEIEEIVSWVQDGNAAQNVLPIFSTAGMGKGALVAGVIKALEKKEVHVLFHFCSSGTSNNLHSILHHFFYQGQNVWKETLNIKPDLADPNKKNQPRLPGDYIDTIRYFHRLLKPDLGELEIEAAQDPDLHINSQFFNLAKIALELAYQKKTDLLRSSVIDKLKNYMTDPGLQKNDAAFSYLLELYTDLSAFGAQAEAEQVLAMIPQGQRKVVKKSKKNIVFIIDGLDEAALTNPDKKVSDLFYTYDKEGKRQERWEMPANVKWIFTYRQVPGKARIGYRFEEHEFKTVAMPCVQPLQGLNEKAVRDAFEGLDVSDEFVMALLKKGAVS